MAAVSDSVRRAPARAARLAQGCVNEQAVAGQAGPVGQGDSHETVVGGEQFGHGLLDGGDGGGGQSGSLLVAERVRVVDDERDVRRPAAQQQRLKGAEAVAGHHSQLGAGSAPHGAGNPKRGESSTGARR